MNKQIDNKMKKKIKFALTIKDERVRTLEELKEKFDLQEIVGLFMDDGDYREGKDDNKFCEWLRDRRYNELADKVSNKQKEWTNNKNPTENDKHELTNFLIKNFSNRTEKDLQNIKKHFFDIPSMQEYQRVLDKANASIDNSGINKSEHPEDEWHRYLMQLAWDKDSLKAALERTKLNKNEKRIYLLAGNYNEKKDDTDCIYRLPYERSDIKYIPLSKSKGQRASVILQKNGIDITAQELAKILKENINWKNIVDRFDVYAKNNDNFINLRYSSITSEANKHDSQSHKHDQNLEENSEDAARENLARYMDAQTPLIYLHTYEEDKADEIISETAKERHILEWNQRGFFVKSYGKPPELQQLDIGLIDTLNILIRHRQTQSQQVDNIKNIYMDNAVLVLKDVHDYLKKDISHGYTKNGETVSAAIIAKLKYLAQLIYQGELRDCNIIIVSPIKSIPKELENYVRILEFSYLTEKEIRKIISEFCTGQDLDRGDRMVKIKVKKDLAKELKGLTEFQIVNILSLMLAGDGEIDENDLHLVKEQKKEIIRNAGVLEVVTKIGNNQIGGLEELIAWISDKKEIFTHADDAHDFGVEIPKGVLIVGMPGCGKSLSAKRIATDFDMPLLRMDMGRLLGKYVGESEENMRHALHQANAIAPCVLWIDEIEKAFAGLSGNDGGADVTMRLFRAFLTWMQEKESPVFVVATANDVSALPAELLRKGRFDEVFFIDLPNRTERKQIFELHIRRRRPNDIEINNIDLEKLAEKTDGFCGADIEGVVRESIEDVFLKSRREKDTTSPYGLTTEALLTVIKGTNSLKKMRPDAVKKIKDIYKKYKFRLATKQERRGIF